MRGNVRGWTGLILLLALFLLLSFSVCAEETEEAEPAIMVARVDLTGDMKEIGKKERVLLQIHLEDKAETFDGYAYTSWQGHSSLKNVKKNYTIRLFDDEEMTMKHRMNLREGWQAEHKYILKANYKDLTMSRNLICADLWAEMAATRKSIPDKLKVSSHYGAVDGFAAEVTLNGELIFQRHHLGAPVLR